MPFNRADQAMVFNAIAQLGQHMEKRKRDQMANELLNTLDPGETPATGGVEEITLRNAIQDHKMKRALEQAQLDYYKRRGTGTPTRSGIAASLGEDGLTAKQRLDYDLKKKNVESLIKDREHRGSGRDTLHKISTDAYAATGHSLNEWNALPETSKHLGKDGSLTADFGDGTPVRVPGNLYQQFLGRVNAVSGDGDAEITNPQPLPVPTKQAGTEPFKEPDLPASKATPAPLDPESAKAILAEAGGDKQKARAIARQRGYAF